MNELEKQSLLDRPSIKVLDHGFVRLVDFMGDDSRIVQAARVSTGKGTKTEREDRGLIRYMMRLLHTTPFEKVRFEFHSKKPIFVARQWIRHRTGSFNELSARYSELPEEFYIPERFRLQGTSNMQGGDEHVSDEMNYLLRSALQTKCGDAFRFYHEMLEKGVSKELARLVLPVNTYTEWYWTIDLHNLFHFLVLRMDAHAQWETRQYALAIAEMVKEIVPVAWEAFEDYRLNAMRLSDPEVGFLSELTASPYSSDWDGSPDSVPTPMASRLSKREHGELLPKFERLTGEEVPDADDKPTDPLS